MWAAALLLGTVLSGCATLPPPTAEMEAAQAAVAAASAADAEQYAPDDLALARDALGRAQASMSNGDDDAARKLAAIASAAGDLARARSRAVVAESNLAQRVAAIAELGASLGVGTDAEAVVIPALPAGARRTPRAAWRSALHGSRRTSNCAGALPTSSCVPGRRSTRWSRRAGAIASTRNWWPASGWRRPSSPPAPR